VRRRSFAAADRSSGLRTKTPRIDSTTHRSRLDPPIGELLCDKLNVARVLRAVDVCNVLNCGIIRRSGDGITIWMETIT
jgi:hypothetical protein